MHFCNGTVCVRVKTLPLIPIIHQFCFACANVDSSTFWFAACCSFLSTMALACTCLHPYRFIICCQWLSDLFLQRGRIACNAERCISHGNSVRLSVTRWYPIQTNEDRTTRSSLWSSKNTLVFWYQQRLVRRLLPPKICAQNDPPTLKSANLTNICL